MTTIKWRIVIESLGGRLSSYDVEVDYRDSGEHVMLKLRQIHRKEIGPMKRLLAQTVLMRTPVVSIAKIASVRACEIPSVNRSP